MIDYPRKTFKGLLGMLTGLLGAFLRMHVGLLDRYSPKIVRKVLRRAFYRLARKNVPSANRKARLARKKRMNLENQDPAPDLQVGVINRSIFYCSSASLAISEEIQRPGSMSRATRSWHSANFCLVVSKSKLWAMAYSSANWFKSKSLSQGKISLRVE